jgi:hypothetical protein
MAGDPNRDGRKRYSIIKTQNDPKSKLTQLFLGVILGHLNNFTDIEPFYSPNYTIDPI